MVQCLFRADAPPGSADDDGKFPFIIVFVTFRGLEQGLVVP